MAIGQMVGKTFLRTSSEIMSIRLKTVNLFGNEGDLQF